MHATSAEHLYWAHPSQCSHLSCRAPLFPGDQSGVPHWQLKAPPHHLIISCDWQPPTGRRGLFTSLCSHGTKLMIPANKNNTKREKPEKSAPGWTIWSSFGFLWRGLEKKRLCEENLRDSTETDEAAEPKQKVGAKGRLLRKASVFRKISS